MKIKQITFFILLVSVKYHVIAQNITGIVTDENHKNLPLVNILVKKREDSKKILFFTRTDKDGKFVFDNNLFASYGKDTLYIEASLNGYNELGKLIGRGDLNKNHIINFILFRQQVQELKEVVVLGKVPKFKISKDTISFKVTEYRDGSEMKIEDIIKKLPGIDVNANTGEIIYKGKSIETVTLDGDNLFGFNYTLGTKNINVDMVEQIEAIDNYTENPLLKGIEQGGKVSLNLKLKKNKTNYSGSMATGIGFLDPKQIATHFNGNFLTTSSAFKSFTTVSQNNIGINHSPFDYYGYNLNVEQQKESNFFAKKIIPETIFANGTAMSRANINDQYFGNLNAIIKLDPKLNVKINMHYLKDEITTNQLFQNNYEINNNFFTTSDNTSINKKPQLYRGDFEVKFNASKNSLLEYNLRVRQENIETPISIVQNETDRYSSFLDTKDFYLKHDLLWTKKISERKALQVSFFHFFNKVPQTFSITSSQLSHSLNPATQESKFEKSFFEGKATYMGSGNRDKYLFTVGTNLNFSPFYSQLYNPERTISVNDFDYWQRNIFNTGAYNFNRSNWQISPSYSVRFINQKLEQNDQGQREHTNDVIVEPALLVKYNVNTMSAVSANFGFNQNTSSEQFFFLNQVLINNRVSISNLPSLKLQNVQRYSLMYYNNDLYNQFQLDANVSFQRTTGNFFANQNISENTTQLEYFFLPQDISSWNMNFKISKYIPLIESTFKLTSNYLISNFKNIINNSDLRQNQYHFLSNSFLWKTAFEIPVNFENTFTYQYSNSKSEEQAGFINKSWQNTFKVLIKPSTKWLMILSSDYYLPNTEQSDQQFFLLDVSLSHNPKGKKWAANLTFRNITNETNFEHIQTTDISTAIFRSNLLPRYFLLGLTRNF